MPVIDVRTDTDTRTITLVSRHAAPIDRVWDLFADPRKLEKWWGPETYPAKVSAHDLTPGGKVIYSMTGPEGDSHHGWWEVQSVSAPTQLVVRDGFGDAVGNPAEGAPVVQMTFDLAEDDGQTTITSTSVYDTVEGMQQVLDMGVVEGSTSAINQIDKLLAA